MGLQDGLINEIIHSGRNMTVREPSASQNARRIYDGDWASFKEVDRAKPLRESLEER
jgi:hypothetical protein